MHIIYYISFQAASNDRTIYRDNYCHVDLDLPVYGMCIAPFMADVEHGSVIKLHNKINHNIPCTMTNYIIS